MDGDLVPVFPSILFGKLWTTSNPVEANVNCVMVVNLKKEELI